MTVKIALAIAIALFILISVPSVIATCMLLIKSIGQFGEKRQRRSVFQNRS